MYGGCMNNIKPEQTFPFDKNTLVVLTAKCPEGAAILKQSGSHWFAKPLPRQLQDDNLKGGIQRLALPEVCALTAPLCSCHQ